MASEHRPGYVIPEDEVEALWRDLVDAERRFFEARIALLESKADLEGLVDRALLGPEERGAALRQLMFVQEPRLRQFLPVLIDVAVRDERFAQLVKPLIRSLDHEWLTAQVPRVVEMLLGSERPATEEEEQRTAALLYALDPRLHAAFSAGDHGEAAAVPEAGAVLGLATAALQEAPSGVAQHAIEAALGWSPLFVPASAQGEGDAVVHNTETGARTAVAFTREVESADWGGYRNLVGRRVPAARQVWRGLGIGFEGLLLDPAEGYAGILLPRAALRAVAGGRPQQEVREGDNLALRLAVDSRWSADAALVRDALREALAHGGVLVPIVAGESARAGRPYVLRSSPDGDGPDVLYAFSDREALSRGPRWAGEAAGIVAGGALLDAMIDQGYASLAVNAGESDALVLTRDEVAELSGQLRPA